jgi:hypothetical protein
MKHTSNSIMQKRYYKTLLFNKINSDTGPINL